MYNYFDPQNTGIYIIAIYLEKLKYKHNKMHKKIKNVKDNL